MSRGKDTSKSRGAKSEARNKAAAKKPAQKTPAKAKSSKPKAARKRKAAPQPKAGVRLPWAEVVSRVVGQPAQGAAAAAPQAVAPARSQPQAPAPVVPPTTIRFPAPAPRQPSSLDSFGPDEWVSVTYTGEEVFVHGKAGIFARGTTTHLRGKLARELVNKPGFRVRRAA